MSYCIHCGEELVHASADHLSAIDWQARSKKASTELEQERVRLAGCGVAAQGGISASQIVEPDTYGWSASYQAVLDLRRSFEKLHKAAQVMVDKLDLIGYAGLWDEFAALEATLKEKS